MSDAPERQRPAREPHPSGDERFALLDAALRRARYQQDQLIEILHTAQEVFGHLSPDVLLYVATALRLPRARVHGVATFYHLFSFEPQGEHACSVCTGTACFVKGADAIVDALQRTFGVLAGETTEDGRLTVSTARCLGSCGLAPVVVIDGEVRGQLDAETTLAEVTRRLEPADGDAANAGDPDAGAPAAERVADDAAEVG